jgi:hypothetical protein
VEVWKLIRKFADLGMVFENQVVDNYYFRSFSTSGGRAFSYCFGAACGGDLAEQGVFVSFCAFKKKK